MWVDDDVWRDPFTREGHVLQRMTDRPLPLSQHLLPVHNPPPATPTSHSSPTSHPTNLLPVLDATRSLLPMPAGKLVPNLRDPNRADFDLAKLVPFLVDRHHHLSTAYKQWLTSRTLSHLTLSPTYLTLSPAHPTLSPAHPHLVNNASLAASQKCACVFLGVLLRASFELWRER